MTLFIHLSSWGYGKYVWPALFCGRRFWSYSGFTLTGAN